jgi:hypothetical protein
VFFSSAAGANLVYQFQYYPSVIEARSMIGDAPIGGLASVAESVVGVLKDAQISTSLFDASVDWTNTFFAKTAAGGIFTAATAATGIPNVIVQNSPNAANPFLILSLNVA